MVVKEGKNRLVLRLWESQGVTVSRLIRVRFGDISLPRNLRLGKWVELENFEEELMKNSPDTTKNTKRRSRK